MYLPVRSPSDDQLLHSHLPSRIKYQRSGTLTVSQVWFGNPIDFQDLLDEHERKHGPLWKLPPTPAASPEQYQKLLQQ
jgi:hypothetical protein